MKESLLIALGFLATILGVGLIALGVALIVSPLVGLEIIASFWGVVSLIVGGVIVEAVSPF